jgi:hypothetical protein
MGVLCARAPLPPSLVSLSLPLTRAHTRSLTRSLSYRFTPSTPSSFTPVCVCEKKGTPQFTLGIGFRVYCSRLRTEVTCEITASVTFSRASACRSSTFCVRVVCAYACVRAAYACVRAKGTHTATDTCIGSEREGKGGRGGGGDETGSARARDR